MGQEWALPTVGTLAECMRVLKPGGFFLAHGGTRTYDLLTMALRMAGFLIRDSISVEGGLHRWYHGQGFAKSTKKALLRPLWEPIIHAVKPGPLRELNIDAGRVAHAGASDLEASLQRNPGRDDQASSDAYGACWPQQRVNVTGRYPPNACSGHAALCGVWGGRRRCAGIMPPVRHQLVPGGAWMHEARRWARAWYGPEAWRRSEVPRRQVCAGRQQSPDAQQATAGIH